LLERQTGIGGGRAWKGKGKKLHRGRGPEINGILLVRTAKEAGEEKGGGARRGGGGAL